MHEKHKAWKREFGFDRIETAAEMDEKRSRTSTSPVPNLFFYRNMAIPRHPHTPDEFTLEMKVDVEGLRMEIILSQPASSQCDPSPRRAAVDTGSEEPGTPLQSPAIGTGSEEPEASRAPFETSMDGFLRSNFTSMEQEYTLLQSNVGVNDNRVQPEVGMDDNNDATTQQAAVREEFVSPTEKRQGTTTWATEQHKLFYRGRSLWCNYFSEKINVLPVSCLLVFSARCILPALSIIFFSFCPQLFLAKIGTKSDMSYLDALDA